MKLITLRTPDRLTLGILTERGVLDLGTEPDRMFQEGAAALAEVERSVAAAENDPSTVWRNLSDVALGPVVPNPGKTLDGCMPIGPHLVIADEIPDPQDLRIRCWVSDDLRQDSNTSDMIFSVAECLSYASHHFTLEPGDIISTGTPEGVVLGREPKDWLVPGDVVTVEIEGLGRLTNTMAGGA